MQKIINLRDAQVSTATIEIRTLTVSNKQVTLAVFRQLIEEELINEDGNLNGVPWGTVNYHPDKCGDARAHIHVVWQNGRDLRRAKVDLEPFQHKQLRVKEMEDAEYLAARDFLIGRSSKHTFKFKDAPAEVSAENAGSALLYQYRHHEHFMIIWTDQQRTEYEKHRMQCMEVLRSKGKAGYYSDFKEENMPATIEQWKAADKHYFATETAEKINAYANDVNKIDRRTLVQFWPTLTAAIGKEMQRRERWMQQIANLQTLPQLFIAV